MKTGLKTKLLAFSFLFFAIIVGAGFWAWSWWQRKNAPFVCPIAWQYCRKAKLVQLPSGKPAIGFVVPQGTEVLASVGGQAIQGGYRRADGQVSQTVRIKATDGRQLSYAFVGQALVQMQTVAPGQPLGRVKSQAEAVKGTGANLVVYLLSQEGEVEPLELKDFRPAR